MTRYSKLWLAAFSLATVAFAGCTNDEDLGGRSASSDGGTPTGDGSNPANAPDASISSDAGSCSGTTDCAIERCDCTSGFTKETLEVQPKCIGGQCVARTRACTDGCSSQGLQWLP